MMERPYICIAGKNNIAVDVLKYLVEHYGKEKLCVVCNKTETGENGFQRSLRQYSQMIGVPESRLEDMYGINNLVFLSLEYDQIIKPQRFVEARLYNIHFSLLPKYKGMFTSAHPILNGEKYSGVTLHNIDAGIDTGDIIDQERFDIGDSDCRELYLKYIQFGTAVVLRNIENIIWNRTIGKKQNKHDSTYYSRYSIAYNNLEVNLNQTAEGVQRQLRAYSFREYQLPMVFGKPVIDSRILNSKSTLKPGKIVFKGVSFAVISTVDYDLTIYCDRFNELMEACENGWIEIAKDICSVRKHINGKDTNGLSPLFKATYFNHKEIVQYLISNGADINDSDQNGTNLLIYAKDAYKRSRDNSLFKLFVHMGLSVKEMDYMGRNLLSYIEEDHIKLEELME